MSYLLPCAKIHWQDATSPYSGEYQDIYCDRDNGPAEKDHVYIRGNHLPQKWKGLPNIPGSFCILEAGFGFALGFLQTVKEWRAHGKNSWNLHYIAVEKHPVSKADIKRFYTGSHLDPSFLLEQYPIPAKGFHRLYFDHGIHLTLIFDDLLHVLTDIDIKVDAWFLDGFKPSSNPDMWSPELFVRLRELSRPGASFATYSTAGLVKQNAKSAGLLVSKHKGFGRKSEMLQGQVKGNWVPSTRKDKSITVVGAGIAGLCVINQLKKRGIRSQLIEQEKPMCGASGIRQLAISPRLARKPDSYSRFSLNAFLFTVRSLKEYLHQCGLHSLPGSADEEDKFQQIAQYFQSEPDFICARDQGLVYGRAGWFSSDTLSEMCGQIGGIIKARVTNLQRKHDSWQIIDDEGNCIHESDSVILAMGAGSSSVKILSNLPLKNLKGHSLAITHNLSSLDLPRILAGDVSILPPLHGLHTLNGGYQSYSKADKDGVDEMQIEKLVTQANKQIPGLNPQVHSAQAAFRCVSRDRLPLVDGVPSWGELDHYCQSLRFHSSHKLPAFTHYQPGLWLHTAFGSHGMTHGPLCSEYLVSRILEEPWPVSKASAQMFSSLRFALRDTRKQMR